MRATRSRRAGQREANPRSSRHARSAARAAARSPINDWLGPDLLGVVCSFLPAQALRRISACSKVWHAAASPHFADTKWQAKYLGLHTLLWSPEASPEAVEQQLASPRHWGAQFLAVTSEAGTAVTSFGPAFDAFGRLIDRWTLDFIPSQVGEVLSAGAFVLFEANALLTLVEGYAAAEGTPARRREVLALAPKAILLHKHLLGGLREKVLAHAMAFPPTDGAGSEPVPGEDLADATAHDLEVQAFYIKHYYGHAMLESKQEAAARTLLRDNVVAGRELHARGVLTQDFLCISIELLGSALVKITRGRSRASRQEGVALCREALSARLEVGDSDDDEARQSALFLAAALTSTYEYEEAEAILRDQVERSRRIKGAAHAETTQLLGQLTDCMLDHAQYLPAAEAAPARDEAIETLRYCARSQARREGKNKSATLNCEMSVLCSLNEVARYDEALALGRELIARMERHRARPPPQRAASAPRATSANLWNSGVHLSLLREVGEALFGLNRLEEAEPVLREALELLRKVNLPQEPTGRSTVGSFGPWKDSSGDLTASEADPDGWARGQMPGLLGQLAQLLSSSHRGSTDGRARAWREECLALLREALRLEQADVEAEGEDSTQPCEHTMHARCELAEALCLRSANETGEARAASLAEARRLVGPPGVALVIGLREAVATNARLSWEVVVAAIDVAVAGSVEALDCSVAALEAAVQSLLLAIPTASRHARWARLLVEHMRETSGLAKKGPAAEGGTS
jgi:tetratricopeptide (TPR) repeat protein